MAAAGKSFDDITARLDEIIAQVRSKDTSLERSLDLFDEAIELGSQAVELVDSLELSEREAELLDAQPDDAQPDDAQPAAPETGARGGADGSDGGAAAAQGGAGDGASGATAE